MNPLPPPKKKIVFLFSDTGGGHRSSTEAIIEALNLEFPEQFLTEMIDIFRDYAPTPIRYTPEFYPQLTRNPRVWEAGYRMSNGRRKAELFTQIAWPYIKQAIMRLVKENPCDLFVSVHPFANRAILNIIHHRNIPLITVVTDMVSAHAFWFDPRASLVIVPTEIARKKGIEYGMPRHRIVTAGQPVAERFCDLNKDKTALRQHLNWPQNLPITLLIGGGEGMGPLEKIALAIDDAGLQTSQVIVTGRNQALLERLQQRQWKFPARVYGFVKEMPDFMAAADILVTKAGPGTISEAFIAGLPLILYSRLPGQEDGNVNYVVDQHAGVWAPETKNVLSTLRLWLEHPEKLAKVSSASKNLARPEATRQIARLIASQVFMPTQNRLLLPSTQV